MRLNIVNFTKIIFATILIVGFMPVSAMFEEFLAETPQMFEPHPLTAFGRTQMVGKGIIQATNTLESIPNFRIYFEGKVAISDDDGFYSFPVDNPDISKYRIVITRRLQHMMNRKNTIDNFRLIPDKNYICYTFKKTGRWGTWTQKEKMLNHKNFILPQNSIVVLIDPKYVESIEEWNIDLSKNVIKLPKIVLKANVSENKLKRIAAKSLLYMEDALFHEKVGRKNSGIEVKNNKIKITLP